MLHSKARRLGSHATIPLADQASSGWATEAGRTCTTEDVRQSEDAILSERLITPPLPADARRYSAGAQYLSKAVLSSSAIASAG